MSSWPYILMLDGAQAHGDPVHTLSGPQVLYVRDQSLLICVLLSQAATGQEPRPLWSCLPSPLPHPWSPNQLRRSCTVPGCVIHHQMHQINTLLVGLPACLHCGRVLCPSHLMTTVSSTSSRRPTLGRALSTKRMFSNTDSRCTGRTYLTVQLRLPRAASLSKSA